MAPTKKPSTYRIQTSPAGRFQASPRTNAARKLARDFKRLAGAIEAAYGRVSVPSVPGMPQELHAVDLKLEATLIDLVEGYQRLALQIVDWADGQDYVGPARRSAKRA